MRFLYLIALLFVDNAFASNDKIETQDIASEELRCLSMNIYFEARGEPTAGQVAVAMVTMNRVLSKRYPSSVCKVVWQRRQFSWTHDGRSDRPKDRKAWVLAQQIAEFVHSKYATYNNLSNGALDLTNGALHYYAPKLADPRWSRHKEVTREIGNHRFMKSRS